MEDTMEELKKSPLPSPGNLSLTALHEESGIQTRSGMNKA